MYAFVKTPEYPFLAGGIVTQESSDGTVWIQFYGGVTPDFLLGDLMGAQLLHQLQYLQGRYLNDRHQLQHLQGRYINNLNQLQGEYLYELTQACRSARVNQHNWPNWSEAAPAAEPTFSVSAEEHVVPATPGDPSIFDLIKETSIAIEDGRWIDDVLIHTITEVGELAIEVQIKQGNSYKTAGTDGIFGESVDILICVVDMMIRDNPEVTEDQVVNAVKAKLQKWTSTKDVVLP